MGKSYETVEGTFPWPAIARRSDPFTSHLTVDNVTDSGRRAVQRDLVREAVELIPGCTARELGDLLESDSIIDGCGIAHRRLSELRQAGLVAMGTKRKCTISGVLAITWWIDFYPERSEPNG